MNLMTGIENFVVIFFFFWGGGGVGGGGINCKRMRFADRLIDREKKKMQLKKRHSALE